MKKYMLHIIITSILCAVSCITPMDQTTRNSLIRAAAQQHNSYLPLLAIPKELSDDMLVNKNNSFTESIKAMLALSVTCTHFDSKLPYLGQLLQCYDVKTKNKALKKLLSSMNDLTYWHKKRAALLLVYAGADHNVQSSCSYLFEKAVNRNDLNMVTLLFQQGANANFIDPLLDDPIFFHAKIPEMVTIFGNNNANFNTSSELYPNVLWYLCGEGTSDNADEIMQIYIDKGVDLRKMNLNNQSLLHEMANNSMFSDAHLKIARFTFTKAPDMINALDKQNNTPLDLLIKNSWGSSRKNNLISLFKEYGAKTAQELKPVERAISS